MTVMSNFHDHNDTRVEFDGIITNPGIIFKG